MDHSGKVQALKYRVAEALKLLQTDKKISSHIVDLTHKMTLMNTVQIIIYKLVIYP